MMDSLTPAGRLLWASIAALFIGLSIWTVVDINTAEPIATNQADALGLVVQPGTTQARRSTTTAAPTTIDLSPVVSLDCPYPDAGPWDWYDASFGPNVRLSNEFASARIDYGDGRSYSSFTAADAEQNMFWHRYSSPGSFVVSVTVTDVAGRSGGGSCTFTWTDTRRASLGSTSDTNRCDPNYEGACVPIASDVDCSSGSGNGPAYVTGPVYVVGSDIYGLDRDNDGIGCE